MQQAIEAGAHAVASWMTQEVIPNTAPKEAAPNSRRTMIGDRVVTLPIVAPSRRHAATMTAGTGQRASDARAMAAHSSTPAAVTRGSIWSAKRDSSNRLTSAATAVAETVADVPAAPRTGASIVTWCVTKPTCTSMPMPKATMTLRSAAVPRASLRVQRRAGAAAATTTRASAPSGNRPMSCGRCFSTNQASGSSTASATTAAIVVVAAKPAWAMPNNRIGTPAMPPTLAPSEAIDTARPWYFSNHGASAVATAVMERQAQPTPITMNAA